MFNGFEIPSSLILRAYPKRIWSGRTINPVDKNPALGWEVPVKGGSLNGVLLKGSAHHSAMLHFYGAGMSVNREIGRLEWLHQHYEMTVGCLDYRGYGATALDWDVDQLVEDGVRAFDALEAAQRVRQSPYADSARIHLQGFSMGAAVALQVALRRPQAASLILLAPPASWDGLQAAFLARYPVARHIANTLRLRVSDSVRKLFDIDRLIPDVSCPTLIIHGDADQTVPLKQGQMLFVHSDAGLKELVVAQGSTHCTLPYKNGVYEDALSPWLWQKTALPRISPQELLSFPQ